MSVFFFCVWRNNPCCQDEEANQVSDKSVECIEMLSFYLHLGNSEYVSTKKKHVTQGLD